MAVARDIGSEHANLAIGNLTGRTGVLPRYAARRFALLEEALDPLRGSSINNQHRIIVREMLNDILAHQVAQCIGIPSIPAEKRLLPPRTRIASCLGAHPPRLTPFITKQAVQEQSRVDCRTSLRK